MAKSKKGKTASKSATDKAVSEKAETAIDDVVETAKDIAEDATEVAEKVEETAAEVIDETVEAVDEVTAETEEQLDSASAIEGGDDDPAESEIVETESEPEAAALAESEAEQSPTDSADVAPEPQIIEQKVIERKGGFFPMALGGVVAAGLGFAAAQFTDISLPFGPAPEPDPFKAEVEQSLDAQAEQIAALGASVENTQKAIEVIDLNPVMSALAGVEDQIAQANDAVANLEDQVVGFDSRLTALEKQPVASAVGPEAIAAYERELGELRAAIQDQKDALVAQKAEIETMAKDAMAAEAGAEEQATLAASRAALAELTSAAQAGRSFAGPLSVLAANGVAVPDALSAAAADGVPTLAALATEFPGVAREALSVARSSADETEEGGGGFASFLQNQLGARSVTPREGDDPDAVLSRAEAAVKNGDLDAALTEISALPEGAQSVLADWTSKAELRRDALSAASDLAQQLNQ